VAGNDTCYAEKKESGEQRRPKIHNSIYGSEQKANMIKIQKQAVLVG
jgi:hypothetical protein